MTDEHPNHCDATRALLLDHAYGLLEGAEAAAVESHLADCEACRRESERAAAHSELLSDAARIEDPDLDLSPPPAIPLWRRGWFRGLAAAALLIGVGIAGYRSHVRSSVVRENPVFTYTASNQVDPGGAARFELALATLDGDPSPGEIACVVTNGALDAVLEKTIELDSAGRGTFELPARLGGLGEPLAVAFQAKVDGDVVAHTEHTIYVGGELRARVATDKPLYRPGETVRVRAVALERLRLTPAGDLDMALELRNPRDEVVASADLRATDGVAAWVGTLPENAKGGTYKLVLSHDDARFPAIEQPIQVRTYRNPRVLWTTDLDADSYAPGGRGALDIEVARAEGGVPSGARVDASLRVDGETVWRDRFTVPADGVLRVPFTLPADVREGRAAMALVLSDGGNVESHTERIPLALGRLDVAFFPESGDLVAGLPTRVYFRVSDPTGEPADLAAEVVDGTGQVVARAVVDVRGMGRFDITPTTGQSYSLRASRPQGVTLSGTFPTVARDGTVVAAASASYRAGEAITARVASTSGGPHAVSVHCRGTEIGRANVTLTPGVAADVSIPTELDVGGVMRLTVDEADGVPGAERLVYREPAQRVDVEMRTTYASYAPGDEVRVQVSARDESGSPTRAVLGMSVIDRAVVSLADDRDTASLPLHFLLGLDVDELEDVASFSTGADAAHAVDLLLGVQGWRRFAWVDAQAFRERAGPLAARIVPVVREAETATWDVNGDEAERVVAATVRRADSFVGALGILGGLAGAFFGGLVLVGLGLWRRSWLRASIGGGLTTLSCLIVLVPMLLFQGGGGCSAESRLADAVGMAAPGSDVGAMGTTSDAWEVEETEGIWIDEEQGDVIPLDDVTSGRVVEATDDGDEPVPVVVDPAFGQGRYRIRKLDAKNAGAFLVRVYAFQRRTDHDGTRSDFADVLYWNPLVVTDARGQAEFTFDTCDAVSTFEIRAEAHDARGALGAETVSFLNRVPFHLEPKLPAELSAGDVLSLPIAITNDTPTAMDVRVGVAISGGLATIAGDRERVVNVGSGERGRATFDVTAGSGRGTFDVAVTGSGTRGLTDRSSRRVRVVPRGYPMALSAGGQVTDRSSTTLLLPDRYDDLDGSIRFYPSALSSLVTGLDGLLREPCGCFEQTSSSNHPNVLVLQYLDENQIAAPAVSRRAKEFVESGYDRLTGFEVEGGGFSLYGQAPADPALTAYGLMEFTDIAKVHEVDEALLARTRRWLLAQRNGRGGFSGPQQSWRCEAEIFDTFTLWALVEAETGADLATEVDLLASRAHGTRDAYVLALAANTFLDLQHEDAGRTLRRLADLQRQDGSLAGTRTSIMGSRGVNLAVETTSLAALAFLRGEQYAVNAERAIQWLSTQRGPGGRFGATQATVLALRAVVEYARTAERREVMQTVTVRVNGTDLGNVDVPVRSLSAPTFTGDLLSELRPGLNDIELSVDGEGAIPWSLELRYRTDLPPSSPNCAVALRTTLPAGRVVEGESLTARVTLANRSGEAVPTPLARIGIPAGLEPQTSHLDRLVEEGTIAAYELRPREVTLYFDGLEKAERREIPLELLAAVPGTFEGPASRAYLYYTDDQQVWAPPMSVTIQPR